MTRENHDDLWRDFPEDGDGVRGAVCDRGGLPRLLDRGALGRRARVRALQLDARVDDPRRHHCSSARTAATRRA